MENEELDGILTFDELLEDDYYKSEFEKRVQERLNEINSHSDVKGGNQSMNDEVQTHNEGEIEEQTAIEETFATTENPAVENTEANTETEETVAHPAPATEMTAQQFEQYNEAWEFFFYFN